MSKATGDVKSYDGSGDWFKISEVEAKIDASSISWPDEGTSEYTFEIPASTRKRPFYVHLLNFSPSLTPQMQPPDNTFFESSRSHYTALPLREALSSTSLVPRLM